MTRRAPIIVVVCALLLTVAFWYLLYQPRRQETARYTAQTAELESQRAQVQAQIASLREIERNAEDYRSRLERLAEFIPDDPAQPTALRELQRAADESGVDIVETTFADPEAVVDAPPAGDEVTLAQIATQMTVEGGYFQVVDLLRRIEVDLARAIKIDTVAMAESEESFPRLSVTWTGQMFAVLPIADVLVEGGVPVPPTQPTEGATDAATEGSTPTDGQTAPAPDGTSDTGVS